MKTKTRKKTSKPKMKVKWATFEWKADRKTSKAMREMQEIEKAKQKEQLHVINQLIYYFEGLKLGKGDIKPFDDFTIRVLRDIKPKL